MSFKMNCPNCNRILNVTEKAFGKTAPCPGCNQPVTAPYPAQPPHQASGVDAPAPWFGAVQDGHATPVSAMPLPSGMPPMPQTNGQSESLDFLHKQTATSERSDFAADIKTPTPRSVGSTNERPAALVLIVFYWAIVGFLAIVYALGTTVMAGFASGMSQAAVRSESWTGVLVGELLGALSVGFFLWGLVTLRACYGLWTFQEWGVSTAKRVAMLNIVFSLISLLVSIIARVAIVLNLATLAAGVAILAYLFGRENLLGRLQEYGVRLRQGNRSR